jgi:mannosyltransferase OCH1-like enzyme
MPVVVMGFVKCVVNRQSFKAIYPEVLKRVEPRLITKYGSMVQEFKMFNSSRKLEQEHPKVIWWCWLQGLKQTPGIVRACYNSLTRYLPEYEIKVIDADNWKEYVELPEYIVKKWEKKQIPPALFSDLLRLQLLIKYGGTWVDSTVLCTGKVNESFLDADLFLFQYTPKGTTKNISISNWFISAHSNNEELITVRDMLFAYWKDYNCTLDYYIFHLFFKKVAEEYPEQIASMPYGNSMNSLVLSHHWGKTFEQERWNLLTDIVSCHKLAFRVSGEMHNNKNNYYNYILNSENPK